MKQILIIGAGFTGATLARILANTENYKVTIVDKRHHIGGNAYDYVDRGIRVHKYGPHIFHTNNDKVMNFVKQYGEWEEYKHSVLAIDFDGEHVPFPPNYYTHVKYDFSKKKLIDRFFRPYTKKMWGMELEEIDPKIIDRVPLKPDEKSNFYFNDKHQYMPKNGYTSIIDNMLDHENIEVCLNTSIDKNSLTKEWYYIFNSAAIDEWYNYEFGELPYRSIIFDKVDVPYTNAYPSAVTNFTIQSIYTRVTEWSHFPNHGNCKNFSILTYERPCDYKENDMERYYPVKDIHGYNRKTYKKYSELNHGNMIFIGRCGQYVYIDMDQAINSAMQIGERFLKNEQT